MMTPCPAKAGIAVDLHGQDCRLSHRAAFLPGRADPSTTGVDDLEMRRIERQGHVDVPELVLGPTRIPCGTSRPRTAQFCEV